MKTKKTAVKKVRHIVIPGKVMAKVIKDVKAYLKDRRKGNNG